jgi:hypothetical protein
MTWSQQTNIEYFLQVFSWDGKGESGWKQQVSIDRW